MLLVLKEMLPTYHKWRYNAYGVRERIGKGISLTTNRNALNLKSMILIYTAELILGILMLVVQNPFFV